MLVWSSRVTVEKIDGESTVWNEVDCRKVPPGCGNKQQAATGLRCIRLARINPRVLEWLVLFHKRIGVGSSERALPGRSK